MPPPAAQAVAPTAITTQAVGAYPQDLAQGRAYYYTYDDSGKLIIQEWMDWVFRGGREAGLPRPPLPVVGYLRRL